MPLLEFESGNTFFHRLSPAMKITWGLIVIVWLFTVFNPIYVLTMGIIIFGLAKFGARLSIIGLLKTSLLIGVGSIFIILFQGFFYPGRTVIFRIWGLHPTVEGFYVGLAIGLRLLSIVAASTIIARTTDPRDMFLTLVAIGLPYRLAHGFFTAIRMIPLMEYELQTIKEAQMVRGIATQGGGVRSWFKQMRNFLVPFISVGLRRADQSGIAVEARCFGLREERTYLRKMNFSKNGWGFVAIWLVALIGYVVLTKGNLYGIIDTNPLVPLVE